MFAHLPSQLALLSPRRAIRRFACLAVRVDYGTLRTTTEELHALFERVGNVWDVTQVESTTSGRLLKTAMVRFYHGEYTPGATPDAAPILPPPTPEDVSALKAVVARALTELEKTELNGAKLRVRESFNDDPNQLHEWYDDMAIAKKSAITLQRRNVFQTNPFLSQAHEDDDYRQGFMAGFKLGTKDGSKYRS